MEGEGIASTLASDRLGTTMRMLWREDLKGSISVSITQSK